MQTRQITRSTAGAFEAALARSGDRLIASWYDERDGNAEIYMRAIRSDGTPAGPEIRLTDNPAASYEPSIDSHDDGSVVGAWYDKAADGTFTSWLASWRADGSRRWALPLPGVSRNPVVRVRDGAVSAAWIQERNGADGDGEDVWLGSWTTDGDAIAPPLRLGPAHKTTWNLNAAVDAEGTVWVVFDAVSSTQASELFVARVDRQRTTLTRLTDDDDRESKYPDLALEGGRVALTWFDARDGNTEVYLFTGSPTDLAGTVDRRARRVTNTTGESIGAYVAWNAGRVGLAWSDNTPGQHEVYFQQFAADGRPLAMPTRVTTNSMSSLIPAIVPWRQGFALAWSEFVPASGGHDGRSEIAFAMVP